MERIRHVHKGLKGYAHVHFRGLRSKALGSSRAGSGSRRRVPHIFDVDVRATTQKPRHNVTMPGSTGAMKRCLTQLPTFTFSIILRRSRERRKHKLIWQTGSTSSMLLTSAPCRSKRSTSPTSDSFPVQKRPRSTCWKDFVSTPADGHRNFLFCSAGPPGRLILP